LNAKRSHRLIVFDRRFVGLGATVATYILGATYSVHFRLIEKLVVDFPFMLIAHFSLGVTYG